MNLINRLKSQFFGTSVFKGLLNDYIAQTPAKEAVVVHKAVVEKELQTQKIDIEGKTQAIVADELHKAELLKQKEAFRFRVPYGYNSNTSPDRKPMQDVPFSTLRRMAVLYPIARACINRRIRQITQLNWDITTIDEIEGEEGYESQIKVIKDFFKHPMGYQTRMRELLTILVDDTLTIDAVCFEYQKKRGGEFMYLVPVDPATIALRLTETGGTPLPPDEAYVQIIQGQKVASFTTEEMLYDSMNKRSYSPYGLAPLESLILQCESALRGAMYNLGYLRENNVPEGFVTLPATVAGNRDRVEEWQMWFDAIMAGDQRMVHRLKILPEGAEYTPTKKPEDMSFEKFELWLLQQTCAVFDVPPQDIGITYQVNKATGEIQQELSTEKGLLPLANYLKEIFDHIIQVELGFPELQLEWKNINPPDLLEEVEIASKEIGLGALGVDEYRAKKSLPPLGLDPYIMTPSGPVLVKDFLEAPNPLTTPKPMSVPTDENGKPLPQDNTNAEDKNNPKTNEQDKTNEQVDNNADQKMVTAEIRAWQKVVSRLLDEGKKIQPHKFKTKYLDKDLRVMIEEGLLKVATHQQAKALFEQFIDPEMRASFKLLKLSDKLLKKEHESLKTKSSKTR